LITFFSEKQSLFDIAACVMQGMKEEGDGAVIHGRSISIPPIPSAEQLLEQFREQEVSAVIFLGAGYLDYPDSLHESMLIHEISRKLPVVIVGCPVESLPLDCVYGDPRPQLQEYLEKAYKKGLRRFAYLGSEIKRIHFQERVEVFKEFLLDHGVRWERRFMPTENLDPTGQARDLLALDAMPEVVIAANLRNAYAMVMEAQRRNLTPGKDIHILCFASIEEDAKPILPYATVILLDEVAMGRRAFEIAHQRLRDAETEPRCERLPAKFLNHVM
jgi:DNA-binding LacI/PurR family transcriptional regulator